MTATSTDWIEGLFSERAKRAGKGPVGVDHRALAQGIALGSGHPDHSSMPITDLIESARIAMERDGEWALQYAFGAGTPELVDALIDKLARDQGIKAKTENILITNGASQALGLIFETFIDPGDVVLSEVPFFLGAVRRLHSAGAEVREVELDDEGIQIDQLKQQLEQLKAEGRHAKFLYLVPTFQNPTGITYSEERRKQIIELCAEHQVPIIEDDAYFDLRYEGSAVPTFYSLAPEGLVLYVGTFSKIIGAGLRLGWVVGDPNVIAHLTGVKTDVSTNTFTSYIIGEFTSSGTLAEHIVALKDVYRKRRDAALAALEREMPAGVSWSSPDGGFFVWVNLPEGVNGADVAAAVAEQGVTVGLGTMFYSNGGGEQNLRLSYSFIDEPKIDQGIAILADAIRSAKS